MPEIKGNFIVITGDNESDFFNELLSDRFQKFMKCHCYDNPNYDGVGSSIIISKTKIKELEKCQKQ